MEPTARRRKARPERIRVSLFDDSAGALPLPLPSPRMWPLGLVFAVMFAIFGARSPEQVDGWIGAAALDLGPDDLNEIAGALERTGAGAGPVRAATNLPRRTA